MAEEVKLFGMWESPYSRRIELALKLKGIQYEYIDEDLCNKSPLLLKYNPIHKKIPVLLHNGKPIAESLVILEYIDETWKDNPILPQDPYDRALALFWAKFIDDKLLPAALKVFLSEDDEGEKIIEEVCQQLKTLENELNGKEFFGGDSMGYLDIVAMVIAFWFSVVQEVVGVELLNEEKFPVFYKWIGKLCDFAIVKECLPPREEHLAYIKALFEASKASK